MDALAAQARQVEAFGGGVLRHHAQDGAAYPASPKQRWDRQLNGADLITHRDTVQAHFPYLNDDTCGVLHVRRCGALSAQQLGMYLLEEARSASAQIINGSFLWDRNRRRTVDRGNRAAANAMTYSLRHARWSLPLALTLNRRPTGRDMQT